MVPVAALFMVAAFATAATSRMPPPPEAGGTENEAARLCRDLQDSYDTIHAHIIGLIDAGKKDTVEFSEAVEALKQVMSLWSDRGCKGAFGRISHLIRIREPDDLDRFFAFYILEVERALDPAVVNAPPDPVPPAGGGGGIPSPGPAPSPGPVVPPDCRLCVD